MNADHREKFSHPGDDDHPDTVAQQPEASWRHPAEMAPIASDHSPSPQHREPSTVSDDIPRHAPPEPDQAVDEPERVPSERELVGGASADDLLRPALAYRVERSSESLDSVPARIQGQEAPAREDERMGVTSSDLLDPEEDPDTLIQIAASKISLRSKIDKTPFLICSCLCFTLGLTIFLIVYAASMRTVYIDEQLLIMSGLEGRDRSTRNGPFVDVVWPHTNATIRKVTKIGQLDYAAIRNEKTLRLRHEPGPCFVYLDGWEVLETVHHKIVLERDMYIRLIDRFTGEERVVRGPTVLVPEPLEESSAGPEKAWVVNETTGVITWNKTSGMKQLETGKGLFMPAAYQTVLGWRHALLVEALFFAKVQSSLTGEISHHDGPTQLFLGPYDDLLSLNNKTLLEKDDYVRLLNKLTGEERVERGPKVLTPEPYEQMLELQKGVPLDSESAVLVRDKKSSEQTLVTSPGVFIPAAYQEIVEVRKKIQVLPHQAVVVRDGDGKIALKAGNAGTSFFLEPFSSLIQMDWSVYDSWTVGHPPPKETIDTIDLRVSRLRFNATVRTKDNVALNLLGTATWEVQDVLKMFEKTADPSSDVYQQVRSSLMQAVGQVGLVDFMLELPDISAEAAQNPLASAFYADRGLQMHAIDVARYECADPATDAILQSIIASKTDALNELMKTASDADVAKAKLIAEIDYEKERTNLIRAKAW